MIISHEYNHNTNSLTNIQICSNLINNHNNNVLLFTKCSQQFKNQFHTSTSIFCLTSTMLRTSRSFSQRWQVFITSVGSFAVVSFVWYAFAYSLQILRCLRICNQSQFLLFLRISSSKIAIYANFHL